MSRREEAKADRRRRIIAAARDLIRETGDAGLSMRAIASRAGVSLTTPYNLFGSKRAVVLAVLEDVREFHERFASFAPAGGLERIFRAVSISIGYYVADPDFYRTLWTALLDASGKDARSAVLTAEGRAFWRSLIAQAFQDGALSTEVDPDLLLRSLDFTFGAVMQNWVMGELQPAELEPWVAYGYALTLCGAATPSGRADLTTRIAEHQSRLTRLGRCADAA